ncbi:MAG: hypothetical protein KDA58_02050 [Planctomycetaceae bacterium]|nr:hypothetical protein [Planctomycetaceae bacterium]
MDTTRYWNEFFSGWPAGLPQAGIVITTYQENIPFIRFMLADGTIALERDRPDTIGARKVVLALSAIAAVKMTDTDSFDRFAQMGFFEVG